MMNLECQFIDAIKAVRSYCEYQFGVTPGLKETKDFMDHIRYRARNTQALKIQLENALNQGVRREEVQRLVDYYFPSPK